MFRSSHIIARVGRRVLTLTRYIQNGNRIDDARKALTRVRDTDQEVEDELLSIREAIEFEAEAISSGYSALWKDKSIRKRMYLCLILNAGQQVTGQGTLNSYSTIVYKKVFKSKSQIALINALNATFGILFTLNATWTVDRFGRKFLLIVGAIGMAACMVIVAAVETQTPTVDGAKSVSVGIAIVFLLFLFAFFCKHQFLYTCNTANPTARQAFLGSDDLDLHIRDLLYERPRPGCWHVLANPECRQLDCPTILPDVFE